MSKNIIEHGAALLAAATIALSAADARADQYFVRGRPQKLPEHAMRWLDAKEQLESGLIRFTVDKTRGHITALAGLGRRVVMSGHCPNARLYSVDGVKVPTGTDDPATAENEAEIAASEKEACDAGKATCIEMSTRDNGHFSAATHAEENDGDKFGFEVACDAGENGDGEKVVRLLSATVEAREKGIPAGSRGALPPPRPLHHKPSTPSDASLHVEAVLAANIPTSDDVPSSITPGFEVAVGVEPFNREAPSFFSRIWRSLGLHLCYRYRAMEVASQMGNDWLVVIPDAASHIIQGKVALSPTIIGEKIRFGLELNGGAGIAFAPEVDATNGARLTSTQAFVGTIGGGLTVEGDVGDGDDVLGFKLGASGVISPDQDEFSSASVTAATFARF